MRFIVCVCLTRIRGMLTFLRFLASQALDDSLDPSLRAIAYEGLFQVDGLSIAMAQR